MDFPDTFMVMLTMLCEIMEDSKPAYSVEFRILNCEQFGFPQSRSRVYIVGVRLAHQTREFTWPSAPSSSRSLASILDLPPDPTERKPGAMSNTNIKNLMRIMENGGRVLGERLRP